MFQVNGVIWCHSGVIHLYDTKDAMPLFVVSYIGGYRSIDLSPYDTTGSMGQLEGFGMSKFFNNVRCQCHTDEAVIQAKAVQLLQEERIFCHSVPNEGAGADLIRQTRLIAMGLRKGVADLVVWWPDGIGYLEMKKPGGKQSAEQKVFEQKCHEYGVSYDIAFSLDDVRNAINKHRSNDNVK